MITRRSFVKTAMLAGAPIAAGALVWYAPLQSVTVRFARRFDGFVRSPEARLTAHFDYLTLDAGGVRQFFADYERFRPNFRRRSPLPPEVYATYLMSTDFFQGDADESRLVRYVLFYDPELTRCHNPLATFAET